MNKKRLICEVEPELHRQAKLRAYEEDKTLTQKIVELIKTWLKGG